MNWIPKKEFRGLINKHHNDILMVFVKRALDAIDRHPHIELQTRHTFRYDRSIDLEVANRNIATALWQSWLISIAYNDDIILLYLHSTIDQLPDWGDFAFRFNLCDSEMFNRFDQALVKIFERLSM